jgi:hypothetical protein
MKVPDEPSEPSKFRRYVRWLAVAYYLSMLAGPAGFLVLSATAVIVGIASGGFDAVVVGIFISALACPALCGLFRWWFVWWGRRHWPEPDHEEVKSPKP